MAGRRRGQEQLGGEQWEQDEQIERTRVPTVDTRALLRQLLAGPHDDDETVSPTGPAAEALDRLRQAASRDDLAPPIVDELTRFLGGDDLNLRVAAAFALAELADARALDALLVATAPGYFEYHLSPDDDWALPQARASEARAERSVGRALLRIGEPAVDPLIRMLRETGSPAAVALLGELGDPRALNALLPTFRLTLRGNHPAAATEVAVALARIDRPRALAELLDGLRDRDAGLRVACVHVLGERDLGLDQAVDLLVEALADRDDRVRSAAAHSLARRGDERALKPLVAELNDGRSAAAWALAELGGARAAEALAEALPRVDANIRGAIESALRAFDPATLAQARLARHLASSLGHEETRRAAARVLGDDPEAVTALVGRLTHLESLVRRMEGGTADPDVLDSLSEVAESLGKLGDPRAIEPLGRALHAVLAIPSPSEFRSDTVDRDVVRTSASLANCLAGFDDPRALEPLTGALETLLAALQPAARRLSAHGLQDLRVGDMFDAVVAALGLLRNDRAAEPLAVALYVLLTVLESGPPRVLESIAAVATSLGDLGEQSAMPALADAKQALARVTWPLERTFEYREATRAVEEALRRLES